MWKVLEAFRAGYADAAKSQNTYFTTAAVDDRIVRAYAAGFRQQRYETSVAKEK